ncbi:MAG: DMT family transporter, partial [Rhodobacteraceae bacterium]|nr:DMT family transporter [Paracoccaceae bacterium]
FVALQHLPVADAIAIAFVLPFMMLFLGWLVLGETIGPHRIIACLVGFIGTLLVIQPNLVEAGYYALLPLLGALIFAVFILATRSVAKEIGAVELQAVSGLLACLIILPVLLAAYTFGFLPQALEVRSVDLTTGGLLLALGLIGTCAHLLMTWSLRFAPSATLAPMQYIEIPIATFFGWLIFSDLPDGLAAVGIMVTVCAGLYIIMREHRLAKAAAKLA